MTNIHDPFSRVYKFFFIQLHNVLPLIRRMPHGGSGTLIFLKPSAILLLPRVRNTLRCRTILNLVNIITILVCD